MVDAVNLDVCRLVRESFDEALNTLGISVASAIYYAALKQHSVRLVDIPQKAELFDKTLKQLLGRGSGDLVARCARILARRLGWDSTSSPNTLSELFSTVTQRIARHEFRREIA